MDPEPEPLSYADAGVDRDAAERAVASLGEIAASASRPEVIGGLGGFGGLFALDPSEWDAPVLVSATDGVGTKLDLARRLGRLDTIGIDLVAMVVDDLVVCGAEPLFVNDYVSVGRLDPDRVTELVSGIAEGCRRTGCALVGGETAEHPGVLAPDELDVAGFGVGIVERDRVLGPHRVGAGDAVVAMASSGPHSNGYSLIRRIVEDVDLERHHGLGRPLADVLLEPTRIHAPDCRALDAAVDLHALAHVTGGGIPGNLPRALPDGLGARVDTATWDRPAVFDWLAEAGPVADEEMWATFNCGVGMLAVVAPADAGAAVELLADRGADAWVAGEVVEGQGVELVS